MSGLVLAMLGVSPVAVCSSLREHEYEQMSTSGAEVDTQMMSFVIVPLDWSFLKNLLV